MKRPSTESDFLSLFHFWMFFLLLKKATRVIICQANQKNGKVNAPSQIFLKFNKQIELFILIPKKQIFLKLVKISQVMDHKNH